MDPREKRHGRVQDQRQAQRATASAVQHEVPRVSTVALGTIDRREPQLGQPFIDGVAKLGRQSRWSSVHRLIVSLCGAMSERLRVLIEEAPKGKRWVAIA